MYGLGQTNSRRYTAANNALTAGLYRYEQIYGRVTPNVERVRNNVHELMSCWYMNAGNDIKQYQSLQRAARLDSDFWFEIFEKAN